MRVRVLIEYDGRNFSGWQEQDNMRTIQGQLHKALFDLTGQNIVVHGSGRTDAGVSAKNQIAHFDIDTNLKLYNIMMAMNVRLPQEIRIKGIEKVDDNFHSRYDAKRKTYSYKMYASKIESPLRRNTHLQVWPNLDFEVMSKACAYFVGKHDFKAFCHENTQLYTTVREVYFCEMVRNDDEIIIKICGDGFLHNMVRIICGTILKVGQGKIDYQDIPNIIASCDRNTAGFTLPAFPLLLESVEY